VPIEEVISTSFALSEWGLSIYLYLQNYKRKRSIGSRPFPLCEQSIIPSISSLGILALTSTGNPLVLIIWYPNQAV
jgi:hypothetical protein